jgi:hypothetical protein
MTKTLAVFAVSLSLGLGLAQASELQRDAQIDKKGLGTPAGEAPHRAEPQKAKPPAGTGQAAKAGATAPGAEAKKGVVPETEKDKANKKKCRELGGTWQLGHCNVG